MENRFPLRDSQTTISSALGSRHDDEEDEEESRRNSYTSTGYSLPPLRNSTSMSFNSASFIADGRQPGGPSHIYEYAPEPSINNVFATPSNSQPNSAASSQVDVNVFSTPTPSIRRQSSSLSIPRSPSPIPVADGGRGSFYVNHRSFSGRESRSATPALSIQSGYTGATLNRSNTTGTSNSSTLYSISSQLSSPPSPLHSIAPVRPRFDYGGHQQTLHDSEILGGDPFHDGFMQPVGDGFAPHRRRSRGPVSSASSDVGTISLPPPYTQYPDLQPKPQGHVTSGRRPRNSVDTDSLYGVEPRHSRNSRLLGRAVVLPVPDATQLGQRGGNGEDEASADVSGAHKEWKDKRWMGGRVWVMVVSGLVALLVGLAVGLGVGLGIGYKKGSRSSEDNLSISDVTVATTSISGPSPENTGPPTFDNGRTVFPKIPIGSSFITPLTLDDYRSNCEVYTQDPSAPDFFGGFENIGFSTWACNIPSSKPLLWDIIPLPANFTGKELRELHSVPDPISCAEMGKGKWGGYTVSSASGEFHQESNVVWVDQEGQQVLYAGPQGWREGQQEPAFWEEPLMLYDLSADPSNVKRDGTRPLEYRFGILYNKTVVIREETLKEAWHEKISFDEITARRNSVVNATINSGEVVWMCTWDKTILEVEIMINQLSRAKKAGPKHHSNNFDPDSHSKTTITLGGPLPPPTPTPTPFGDATQFIESVLPGDLKSAIASDLGISPTDLPSFSLPPIPPTDPEHEAEAHPKLLRRGFTPSIIQDYPLRVLISEYRPTIKRLKVVQGIDLTEGDNDPRADFGAIRCQKMVAVPGGGMRLDKEEGEVTLIEGTNANAKRKRSAALNKVVNSDCFCKWSS